MLCREDLSVYTVKRMVLKLYYTQHRHQDIAQES